jgi:hypothetical protein
MVEIGGIEYTDKELAQAANLYPYTWVIQNNIKNEVGTPIDFEKRPWLKAIYNDLSPKQAICKPPQVGMTVCNTLKTLWVAKNLNKQIIYTLPTDGDVKDMVGGSFNRIIAQNPILMSWVKDHDTIEQKTVGNSIIFYRGTFTAKAAMMVPSGLNVHDEVDASDPAVVTQYETRLEGQENESDKWRWYFSHPSLAGHGVDVYWQQSDQKEWYITCSTCNTEQVLSWPDNIDPETKSYICSHCKNTLSEKDRLTGLWRNKDGIEWKGEIVGGYLFSGWHISQLMLHNKTAEQILTAFNDPLKDTQYFYNYVLGLPYVSSDDRIDPKLVLRNCVDSTNPQEGRVVIGVDTGLGLHMTLMNRDGVFYYEHANELTASKNPYARLEELMNRFPRSIVVLDQGGELMLTRQLQQKYPGRVFLCYYNKDRKTVDLVDWGENDEYWKVRVDRNRMMTLCVEELRDVGRQRLNGTKEEWEEWASHFGYLYRERIVVREQKGKDDRTLYGAEYVWKRNGPDHFAHSYLYGRIGMQRYGGEMAKVVGADVLAGIPTGINSGDEGWRAGSMRAVSQINYQIKRAGEAWDA